MRPAIATVIGPGWEPQLVEHARTSGLARVVGRCCDAAGLDDVARRAEVIFVGSEAHWLAGTSLRHLQPTARLIGVATDAPGARLLAAAGVGDVITADTPPAAMLSMALTEPIGMGRVIEVTGPRGAPGRSEVALAVVFAAAVSGPALLIEADGSAPSLGLRMGLSPSRAPAVHQFDSAFLAPSPVGVARVRMETVAASIDAARQRYRHTVLDGGPNSTIHCASDVDEVLVVGEATDIGVVRLARMCETWMGPTPRLVINRHRPGQDLRRVRRATGLEPAVVIPDLDMPAPGSVPHRQMRSAAAAVVAQRTAL